MLCSGDVGHRLSDGNWTAKSTASLKDSWTLQREAQGSCLSPTRSFLWGQTIGVVFRLPFKSGYWALQFERCSRVRKLNASGSMGSFDRWVADPDLVPLGILSFKETRWHVDKDLHTNMLIRALLTIRKPWKEPQCYREKEKLSEPRSLQTMEHLHRH